jgi:hypothetical protein
LRGFDERTVSPVIFIPQSTTTPFTIIDPTRLNGNGQPTATTISIPTLSYQTSFPGGDTEGVMNLEYRIPIVSSRVVLSLFTDVGATGAARKNQLQPNPATTTLLQQQFPSAGVTGTLPFQPGTNFKLRSSAGVELVVQLPIVRAPFRIYWAYNINRMAQVITAPRTQFPGNPNNADPTKPPCTQTLTTNCFDMNWSPYSNSVPSEVWLSQIVQGGANGGSGLINIFNNPQRTNFFDPIKTFRFTVSRTF